MLNRECGFTLMEVLIALSILSIALTAILLTMSSSIKHTEHAIQNNAAQMVSQQLLNQIQLGQIINLPTQLKPTIISSFNRKWYLKARSEKTRIKNVYRVEVSASLYAKGPYFSPVWGYVHFEDNS